MPRMSILSLLKWAITCTCTRGRQSIVPSPITILGASSQCHHLFWCRDHGSHLPLQFCGGNPCNLQGCTPWEGGEISLILSGFKPDHFPPLVEETQVPQGEWPHESRHETIMEATYLGLWKGEEKEGAPSQWEKAGPCGQNDGSPSTNYCTNTTGVHHVTTNPVTPRQLQF